MEGKRTTPDYDWRWAKYSDMPETISRWEDWSYEKVKDYQIVYLIPGYRWRGDAKVRIALCKFTKRACMFCALQ